MMIGELAVRSGRSVHALRWYEAQGLMPAVERDGGGRRVYSALHVGWLDLMDRLRRTGMTIAQMREYTALVRKGHSTLSQRRALLTAHRARVTATIDEWTDALRNIDRKIDFYSRWIASGRRPALDPLVARRAQPKRDGVPRTRKPSRRA